MKRPTLTAVVVTILSLCDSAALADAPAKVLLLPFESAGEAEKAWVAKAVQQNLVAELSRVNSVKAVTATDAAKDQEAALKAAEDAKADYVVFGSYQAVNGDLRITGQVLDANKKEAVAGLKATGTLRDLFGMEDVIANQVKRALPQPVAQAQPEMLKQPVAAAPGMEPKEPIGVDVNQRARELEAALDRTIERLKYAAPYEYSYPVYIPYYFSNYYYTPYYYTPLVRHRHHRHYYPYSGLTVSGAYVGNNVAGRFSVGGGGVGYQRPAGGNYNNFGRMVMNPPGR